MGSKEEKKAGGSFLAVLPIIIFICVFLAAGIACNSMGIAKPFAQFPASMGAFIALISAFFLVKGSFKDKFNWMLKGIAKPNIAIPIIIFALAGGFATTVKACGGVDAIVNLCLNYVPAGIITAGFFIVGCIVSFASGSSVSTIVALAPVALSIALGANINPAIMAAAVMGAAMFGNSTSLISDCTIVSNSVMGIGAGKATKDKLISMIKLYAVPFIITLVLLFIFGAPKGAVSIDKAAVNVWAILPYILVLVLALFGINFFISLSSGIFLAYIIGVAQGTFDWLSGATTVASGMFGMANMILLFVYMAGTIGIMNEGGGVEWIISHLTKLIKGPKSAQAVIFVLGILVTCCVGNDTIPMVTIGDVAKDITKEYKLDPRRVAAIIPVATASTAVTIPYTGAALTMASNIEASGAQMAFLQIVPFNFFVILAVIFVILTIFIPFSDSAFKKDPWNFEKWCPESEA